MVEINVYTPIGTASDVMFRGGGFNNSIFSAETVKNILSEHTDEKEIKFNIHCDGGSVSEGFAIYDILRGSGKTIYTNIEGGCHSMAIILLLAAPYGNRTANKNARALMHYVYAQADGMMNSEQLQDLADFVQSEQSQIIDIYEDRTDTDRTTLEKLMSEERELSTDELLKYGFISKINTYTTNFKPNTNFNKMAKPKLSLSARTNRLFRRASNLLKGAVNYAHYDVDGEKGFETDAEDDHLEVGMPAYPNDGSDSGTFDLGDRIVVIKDNVIESVDFKEADETEEALAENLAESLEIINELKSENARLRNQLGSRTSINGRSHNPKTANRGYNTAQDYVDAIKSKNNTKGGR